MLFPLTLEKTHSASAESRANRLRYLRKLVRLPRRAFDEKYDIATGTLQNWEDARYGGLTEKGAKKILIAFAKEGLHCQLEWLLYGQGEPPQEFHGHKSFPFQEKNFKKATQNPPTQIQKELQLFEQSHPNTVSIHIPDKAMEPILHPNDLVAGIWKYNQDIDNAVDKVCIVQTQNQEVIVRMLKPSQTCGKYHLICSNLSHTLQYPIQYDVQIISAAPIIWIRREEHISIDLLETTS